MALLPDGLPYDRVLIDGEWVASTSDEGLAVENPATAELIATVPAGSAADADRALAAAAAAQPAWAARPAIERGRILLRWASLIERDTERLAPLVTAEVGKTIPQAKDDLGAAVMFLTWAAESARRLEGEILPAENPAERIYIHRVPYGVAVALTAWNFPPALFARKAGPALVTGNTVVVKPHELTPLSTLEIARLGVAAGLPPGTLNVVTGAGRTVGAALVAHPLTRLVTMTGSVRAGREIMRAAAENVTMVRLELGGKAPFIVMEDADLDRAVAPWSARGSTTAARSAPAPNGRMSTRPWPRSSWRSCSPRWLPCGLAIRRPMSIWVRRSADPNWRRSKPWSPRPSPRARRSLRAARESPAGRATSTSQRC